MEYGTVTALRRYKAIPEKCQNPHFYIWIRNAVPCLGFLMVLFFFSMIYFPLLYHPVKLALIPALSSTRPSSKLSDLNSQFLCFSSFTFYQLPAPITRCEGVAYQKAFICGIHNILINAKILSALKPASYC